MCITDLSTIAILDAVGSDHLPPRAISKKTTGLAELGAFDLVSFMLAGILGQSIWNHGRTSYSAINGVIFSKLVMVTATLL